MLARMSPFQATIRRADNRLGQLSGLSCRDPFGFSFSRSPAFSSQFFFSLRFGSLFSPSVFIHYELFNGGASAARIRLGTKVDPFDCFRLNWRLFYGRAPLVYCLSFKPCSYASFRGKHRMAKI